MLFTEKTVVVIGATGGLGTAITRAFAAEGATLALAGRSQLSESRWPATGSFLVIRPTRPTQPAWPTLRDDGPGQARPGGCGRQRRRLRRSQAAG